MSGKDASAHRGDEVELDALRSAWPLTAFGTTAVYLLVGGLDVLLARQMARRAKSA